MKQGIYLSPDGMHNVQCKKIAYDHYLIIVNEWCEIDCYESCEKILLGHWIYLGEL